MESFPSAAVPGLPELRSEGNRSDLRNTVVVYTSRKLKEYRSVNELDGFLLIDSLFLKIKVGSEPIVS